MESSLEEISLGKKRDKYERCEYSWASIVSTKGRNAVVDVPLVVADLGSIRSQPTLRVEQGAFLPPHPHPEPAINSGSTSHLRQYIIAFFVFVKKKDRVSSPHN